MVISSCHEYCETSVIRCFPTIKDKVNYQDRRKRGIFFLQIDIFVDISYEDTQKNLLSRIKFYYVSSGSGCCIIDYAPLTLKKNTVRSFEQHCLPVLT